MYEKSLNIVVLHESAVKDLFIQPHKSQKPEKRIVVLLNNEGYKCPHCKKTFKFFSKLKAHLLTHNSHMHIQCAVCYDMFTEPSKLHNHLKSKHRISSSSDRCNFVCLICGKHFKTRAHLKKHTRDHEINRCGICQQSFKSREQIVKHNLDAHCKQVFANKFRCRKCDKEYDSLQLCMAHHMTHAADMINYCKQCSKSFAKKSSLKYHIQSKHSGERKICDICGASLQDDKGLIAHMKLHDPNFKRPERSSPEKCELCHKTYRNLKKHHDDAHNKNGGKNFQCQICGQFFRQERGLQFHMMYHKNEKPFECKFCGKRFILKTFLTTHLRSHPESGIDPFKCEFCGKKFARKIVYQEHKNRHLGVLLAKCDICSKSFGGKRSLGQHKSLCHSDKSGKRIDYLSMLNL